MTRYNKKFFAVGKVYDTAVMSDNEIESSIQKDLDTYVGKDKVEFKLSRQGRNVAMFFHRLVNYDELHADPREEILDVDAYILCRIGLNGFKLPDMWYVPLFGYSYSFEHKVFKECYKKVQFF